MLDLVLLNLSPEKKVLCSPYCWVCSTRRMNFIFYTGYKNTTKYQRKVKRGIEYLVYDCLYLFLTNKAHSVDGEQ